MASNLLSANRANANEYAELKQRVKDRGLLDKQPRYYAFKIPLTLMLLAIGLAFFLLVDNPPLQMLNAVFLGFVFQQLSEIGHDLGHQQISRTRWKNVFFGILLGDLILGMSRDWWIGKHNRHHANPNQLDMDPDIDIPVIAFTREQALSRKGLARLIVKYQAYLILPLMVLQSPALHGDSVSYVWLRKSKHNTAEALLLLMHFILFFAIIFSRLSPGWALLFILLQQGLFGFFLATIFAPNHKGMAIFEKDTQEGFLRRQILTARNIKPNPLIDFWYGGLNYQIEHHLFPDMPRNNLGKARGIVKAFCQERGIAYCETGFFESWRDILSYLNEMAAPLRDAGLDGLPAGAGRD